MQVRRRRGSEACSREPDRGLSTRLSVRLSFCLSRHTIKNYARFFAIFAESLDFWNRAATTLLSESTLDVDTHLQDRGDGILICDELLLLITCIYIIMKCGSHYVIAIY